MQLIKIILFLFIFVPTAYADCESDDVVNPEFARSLEKAIKGDVIEQRNIAVSFDAGYLVPHCERLAYLWYKKAAQGGDDIAIEWVSRNDALNTLLAGAECYGDFCHPDSIQGNFTGSAYSSGSGNFFTTLKINGKSVSGMIDTGASDVSMTAEAAKELGLDFSAGTTDSHMSANGLISGKSLIVPTMYVSGVRVDGVNVSCCVTGNVLIGMSYLSRVRVLMAGNTLTIQK
jgi:clan AA aspartic protease (TIGR02281 family)